MGIDLDDKAGDEISKRSRYTPRTANYFLKRCRDFAQVHKTELSKKSVDEALKLLGIDEVGLSPSDRDILHTIINKFAGGPVGLNTLAAALSEEQATIEEFNEPYLIQLGFLDRTPRGRTVTTRGYEHLGLSSSTLL